MAVLGRWRFITILLLFLAAPPLASAQPEREDPPREARLKAVFLFNFVQFTTWPTDAFADRSAPLVIGVLGYDIFGSFLDETVRNELVQGRRIVVERYRTVAEIKNCHILYIGSLDPERLENVAKAVRGKPTLTVTESENAVRRSEFVIGFLTKQNKIRFIINAETASQNRLNLSSKLLHAADEVIGRDRR